MILFKDASVHIVCKSGEITHRRRAEGSPGAEPSPWVSRVIIISQRDTKTKEMPPDPIRTTWVCSPGVYSHMENTVAKAFSWMEQEMDENTGMLPPTACVSFYIYPINKCPNAYKAGGLLGRCKSEE